MVELSENTSLKFKLLDFDFPVDLLKYLKGLMVVFLESLEL